MTGSTIKLGRIPSVCALGPLLQTMSQLFRVWQIYHFADPVNIRIPILKDRIWRRDPKVTGIVIEPHTSYRVDLTENRPGIIIKRGKWTSGPQAGIDNRMMGENPIDGSEHYAAQWQGSHTFFCISSEPVEAELLASEVYLDLREYGPVVRRYLGLHKFAVAEADEIAKLEEGGKNYVVPVSVAYTIEQSWQLKQDAPFFKRLDLSLMGL